MVARIKFLSISSLFLFFLTLANIGYAQNQSSLLANEISQYKSVIVQLQEQVSGLSQTNKNLTDQLAQLQNEKQFYQKQILQLQQQLEEHIEQVAEQQEENKLRSIFLGRVISQFTLNVFDDDQDVIPPLFDNQTFAHYFEGYPFFKHIIENQNFQPLIFSVIVLVILLLILLIVFIFNPNHIQDENETTETDDDLFTPTLKNTSERSNHKGSYDYFAGEDVMASKLDLAKAYIEMEEYEGAKTILLSVLKDGTEKQLEEANCLLGKIPK